MDARGFLTLIPVSGKIIKLGQILACNEKKFLFINPKITKMGYGVYDEALKQMSDDDYVILCLTSDFDKEFRQLTAGEIRVRAKFQTSPNYKGISKRRWLSLEQWDSLRFNFEDMDLKVPKTFGFRTGEKEASHTSISR